MKKKINLMAFASAMAITTLQLYAQEKPLWQNQSFRLYPDRVEQGSYTGKALSGQAIESNYTSPASSFQNPTVIFKFSINGKDNEMRPGSDHHFICYGQNGVYSTPLIEFGKQFVDDKKLPDNAFMAPGTRLTIRLDLRPVLASMKKDGFYTAWNGNRIYAEDLKNVLLAGATYPLSWDFDNLIHKPELNMKDPDGDGIYETTVVFNEEKKERDLAGSWQLSRDISAFPQYHSPHPIADAIYNLSLEEMEKAIEPDSTFRTGKEWAGVWTRDISYSITLAMAYLQPKVAMYSLMKKVKNGKIIQDTGTGGAYPVSTDRMIWAMAAWQVYLATGDEDWLRNSFAIIKKSVDDDRLNAFDKETGLVKGESSFLDWREQTYPKWMQPADIYESFNLGTNAVHFQASKVLSLMARELHLPKEEALYKSYSDGIAKAINQHLWIPEKGYYGQYLYGRTYKILSEKSEALGEALCAWLGIADSVRARTVVQKTPQLSFGIPCIYPQISGISPYHNRAVWPFVQAYWALASKKAGNEEALMRSIAAIYRPAALFLTNKENFVLDDGDYKGTEINSSVMLWSLSGNIALVHKVIFGLDFSPEGLYIKPFVPEALKGKRSLSGIRYRKAIIDISLEGFGNRIHSATINGKPVSSIFIPSGAKGSYDIRIQLDNKPVGGVVDEVPNLTSPSTPLVTIQNGQMNWPPIDGAVNYSILKNGKLVQQVQDTFYKLADKHPSVYQVIAGNIHGARSFSSEQVEYPARKEITLETEDVASPSGKPVKGYSGPGFVEINTKLNTRIPFVINIPEDGTYLIDIRYANGNGPVNTDNKCGIRTLMTGNKAAGVFVFPQRGTDEWSNWGYSNPVKIHAKKGRQLYSLDYLPENENMNGNANAALIDLIRIRKL